MAKEFFSYNPYSGVTAWFDYDESTDRAVITKTQDLQPHIDYAAEIRNAGMSDDKYKDTGWALYCYIPEWLEIEFMKRGLSIDRPTDHKKILRIINTEYPALKLTNKTHA